MHQYQYWIFIPYMALVIDRTAAKSESNPVELESRRPVDTPVQSIDFNQLFHCDLPESMWHPLAVSNNLKGEHDFGANAEAPSRIILAPSLKTYFSVTYGPTAPDTVNSSRRTPGRRSPPGGDQFKAKYGIWPKMEVGG